MHGCSLHYALLDTTLHVSSHKHCKHTPKLTYFMSADRYEHPFLLSDNRHYTFYIWKRIYQRHWSVRFLVVPLYIISGWFNLHAIGKSAMILSERLFTYHHVCSTKYYTTCCDGLSRRHSGNTGTLSTIGISLLYHPVFILLSSTWPTPTAMEDLDSPGSLCNPSSSYHLSFCISPIHMATRA